MDSFLGILMGFKRQTPASTDVDIQTVGGSFYGRYPKVSPEKTYNMFMTTAGAENEEQWLVNFPGYKKVLDLAQSSTPASGVGRGQYNSIRGNLAIEVVGSQVYALTKGLGVTFIGNLTTTTGEVFMAENLNSQICIVDGVNAYIYNYSLSAPNLTIQTDGGSGPLFSGALVPNYVDFHNSFFLFGNRNTLSNNALWYVYEFNSASGNHAIKFVSTQTLQTKPDFPIAVKHIPGQSDNVLVFGTTVTEVQNNVGGLQNYLRIPTRNIDYGCVSVSTIAISDTFVAWLAANEDNAPVIMVYDPSGAQQISTDGIDYTLSQITNPQDSTANLFRIGGHLFYILTFYNTKDNVTIAYDFNTKMFYNITDENLNFWPARQIMYFGLNVFFLSLRNASLYVLDSDITVIDENIVKPGTPDFDPHIVYDMQRFRITPCIRQKDASRFIVNSLSLTIEQGCDPNYTGANEAADQQYIINENLIDVVLTEQGMPMILEGAVQNIQNSYLSLYVGTDIVYRPRVDLALSKDGGATWGNYASRDLHQLGYRKNILQWENTGIANDLCFKFKFIGSYRFVVNNGTAQLRS